MITTTLDRIHVRRPCRTGWKRLLGGIGKVRADDEPLPYARIVEINGLDDALWCCRAEPQHAREWRLFAVWCARQVQHLMNDPRSLAAIDVAERYAKGAASDAELFAARAAAMAAAGSAAWDSAVDAARDAAWAAAWSTAWSSARDAAFDAAAGAAQRAEFLRIVGEG